MSLFGIFLKTIFGKESSFINTIFVHPVSSIFIVIILDCYRLKVEEIVSNTAGIEIEGSKGSYVVDVTMMSQWCGHNDMVFLVDVVVEVVLDFKFLYRTIDQISKFMFSLLSQMKMDLP